MSRIFNKFDFNKDGFIEASDLLKALKSTHNNMNDNQIEEYFKGSNFDEKISYHTFLAMTLDLSEVMSDKKLQSLFKTFDLDGNGEITKEEMRKAFSKICLTISEEEIDEIFQMHDHDSNGTIDINEFKRMMINHDSNNDLS